VFTAACLAFQFGRVDYLSGIPFEARQCEQSPFARRAESGRLAKSVLKEGVGLKSSAVVTSRECSGMHSLAGCGWLTHSLPAGVCYARIRVSARSGVGNARVLFVRDQ
jgi:hypothetical protein